MLIGDTAVGKSCLIHSYIYNTFTDDYEPTVLDVYRGIKNVSKKQIKLEIHDTSGDENFQENRAVTYRNTDIFMLCVAINKRDSFENIERWVSEVRSQSTCKSTPIILVLTKWDCRVCKESDLITYEELNEK